jgi:predicted glycosyltransferase
VNSAAHSRFATVVPDVVFCATGKSGLGHLRRVTNVVAALRQMRPDLFVGLISNAEINGLSQEEQVGFSYIGQTAREQMATHLKELSSGPVIVDTAVLPGLETLDVPLCLILRETVEERLGDFRLPNGREWDLVCVPNPADHWLPDGTKIGAKRIEAVGWIFRQTTAAFNAAQSDPAFGTRCILVASGGGGNRNSAAKLKSEIEVLLQLVRQQCPFAIHVAQVVGPRLTDDGALLKVDEWINAGSRLNDLFSQFDLVISTAGYNSVLELAGLQVPVLLVPITRSLDDQTARSRRWADVMGMAHVEGKARESAQWIAQTLERRTRRPPVKLDTDGSARCASLILELMQ